MPPRQPKPAKRPADSQPASEAAVTPQPSADGAAPALAPTPASLEPAVVPDDPVHTFHLEMYSEVVYLTRLTDGVEQGRTAHTSRLRAERIGVAWVESQQRA